MPVSPVAGRAGDASGGPDDEPVALGALTDLTEFGAIMRHLPDAVVVTDDGGVVVWGNDAMAELIEESLDVWLGRSFLEAIHPDCGLAVVNALSNMGERPVGEVGALLRIRLVTGSGAVREVEARGNMMRVGDRNLLVNVLRTVGDRFDRDVHDGDLGRLRALIDHSPAILMLLDDDFRVLSASAALTRLLGHDNYLVRGQRFVEFAAADQRSELERALARVEPHEHVAIDLPDAWGGLRNFDAHFADLRRDPQIGAIVVTLTDISDLKQAESRLRELADIDPLTGALNRRAFTETLAQAIDAAAEGDRDADLGVLFLDLDRFKPINDVHGHAAGDAVLVEVVARIRRAVRGGDPVGRLGGDEFAVALLGDAAGGVRATIARIRSALEAPIDLGTTSVVVGASIGAARPIPHASTSADELIGRADAEMYRRKTIRSVSADGRSPAA